MDGGVEEREFHRFSFNLSDENWRGGSLESCETRAYKNACGPCRQGFYARAGMVAQNMDCLLGGLPGRVEDEVPSGKHTKSY